MRPQRSQERTAAILIAAFLACLVASLLLAPMIFVQGCPGSTGSTESCRDYPPMTLLGHQANVWLWGAAIAAIVLITVWLVRRADPNP